MTAPSDLRPMREFDPNVRSEVYDELNEQTFTWEPRHSDEYRQYGLPLDRDGRSNWDGLLLIGWRPI